MELYSICPVVTRLFHSVSCLHSLPILCCILSIILCAYWPLISLWRNVHSNPLSIFKFSCFLIDGFLKVSCIFWITVLSQTCVLQIFPSSLRLIFVLIPSFLGQNGDLLYVYAALCLSTYLLTGAWVVSISRPLWMLALWTRVYK